jgi:lantibiotic modifying enzyme
MDTDWTPLLEGDDAARAWEVIDEIAVALTALPRDQLKDATYAGGTAGIALFFAYLAGAQEGRGHEDTASRLLEWAHDDTAQQPYPFPSLFSGFPGVAWVTEHVSGEPQPDADEVTAALLEAPAQLMDEYDVIVGAAGLIVYALGGVRPGTDLVLERAVIRLEGLANFVEDGAHFWTPAERLFHENRKFYPRGRLDLGVAHGLGGVVPALAQALASGRLRPEIAIRAKATLDLALAEMAARRLPETSAGRYPTVWVGDQPSTPSRVAWCYGDLGVGAGLIVAGSVLGDDALREEGIRTARTAMAVAPEHAGVFDAGLCHGSAGNAVVCAATAHLGGGDEARRAAQYWLRDTLARQRKGEGIAGYQSWFRDHWQTDAGLLTGAAGVGLALLAGVTDTAPAWAAPLLVVPASPPELVE